MNLAILIEEAALKFAENPALISNDQRISYRQINEYTNAIAHLLKQLGVVKGDKVALMLPNIPEFVYSYFAAVKIGAVAVPLNAASTAYELSYLLENSDAKALITTEAVRKRFEEIQDKLSHCRSLITVDSTDHHAPFINALTSGVFSNPGISINPEDPAVMIYTSGLTGKPLGAVLTHHNLYSQSSLVADIAKRTLVDKGLSLIPLFHSFGATANMIATMRIGCSVSLRSP